MFGKVVLSFLCDLATPREKLRSAGWKVSRDDAEARREEVNTSTKRKSASEWIWRANSHRTLAVHSPITWIESAVDDARLATIEACQF